MSQTDLDYFRSRASFHRDASAQAANIHVAEIHEELARQYDAILARVELRPKLGIAS